MTNIIDTIKAQRDAYLDSPTLSQDWKYGWYAAVGHVAYVIETALASKRTEAEQRQRVIEKIVATLHDENGAGSDLDYVEAYDSRTGYIHLGGHLDVSQLADEVIRAVRES